MPVLRSYLITGWWSSLIPLTTHVPEGVTTATPNARGEPRPKAEARNERKL